ncbi:MAG: hypothetical protein WC348_02445 [Patescibacteria group bacterium]|jgi:hypothetical protein
MAENREVKFALGEYISGEIRAVGEEISAAWFEWYTADQHKVLQAMGKALGFPVVEVESHDAGNGHLSAKLRRATPEEAAIQAKIAGCEKVDYWRLSPYSRLEAMKAELGDALIHVYDIPNSPTVFAWQWVIDTSKVNRQTFFGKWATQVREDCLEAARAGNWFDAQCAATINFCYAPRGSAGDPERAALLILAEARQMPEKGPGFSEATILTMGRSHGLVYARALQVQLERLRGLFGFVGDLPDMFNVKKVVCGYLEREPKRRSFERRLVEIAEGE